MTTSFSKEIDILVKYKVRNLIWSRAWNQVGNDKVWRQIGNQTWDQVGNQIWGRVRNQVLDRLRHNIDNL